MATMLQPRVIIFLAAILITEVCSVTDFENKVDGILKKVRQLEKKIYIYMCIYIAKKIHEQKVFIQLSITRFPKDDKSVIQNNLCSLGKMK